MASNVSDQPEQICQWCGGTIPAGDPACASCGATRPRDDLVAPGYRERPAEHSTPLQIDQPAPEEPEDDEARARQILKELDAYIPEEAPPARSASSAAGGDDVIMILGILAISAIVGGLLGWFVAPPLLHNLFNDVVGVDTDGPEAFRRLGAFLMALVGLLFGALLGTAMRR
jgi:hypothetical protein